MPVYWFTWSIGSPGAGSLVHWCRFTGSLVHQCTGSLVLRCTGSLVHWFTGSPGAQVYWFTGSLVHWCTGSPGSLVSDGSLYPRLAHT